jgi:LPXTG-motif cell wall-anchored protein
LKKVMLLAAVVAMVLAAAVPALAQTVTQGGTGNINVACVQNAVQQNVVDQGGNAQANQYGDNIIANTNINAQAIAQECNITVAQVNTVVNKSLTFNKAGEVVVVKKFATASASASAPAKVKKTVTASASAAAPVQYKAAAPAQYKAPAAVQYQYATASASAAPAAAAELPSTGGSSLIALGAGVLLVAGGLLARRIVR